jgi:hypothetical protein
VIELLGRWRLERRHSDAEGVHAVEDPADSAVFAGRIHSLQHDQHLPVVPGVENVLQLIEPLAELLDEFLALLFASRHRRCVGRIEVCDPDSFPWRDTVAVDHPASISMGSG